MASRSPSPSSATVASTSPAQPPVRGPSSTTTSRFVFATERKDRRAVERAHRAQVDDLGSRSPSPASVSAAARHVVHARAHRADERHVGALAHDGAPRRSCRRRRRPRHLSAYRRLCSRKSTGLSSRIAALSRPLASAGRGRADDLQPGDALEPADRDLRVDGAEAPAAADGRAHDQRHAGLLVGEVPVLGRLVDQAVHRQRQEVAEHDLDHRAQAGDRAAVRRAGQGKLRDRGVEDAVGAVRLSTRPPVVANTPPATATSSPKKMTDVVALELLVERLADRGAEVHLAHALNSVTGAVGVRERRRLRGLDDGRRSCSSTCASTPSSALLGRAVALARVAARATSSGSRSLHSSQLAGLAVLARIAARVPDVAVGQRLDERADRRPRGRAPPPRPRCRCTVQMSLPSMVSRRQAERPARARGSRPGRDVSRTA